MRERNFDCEVYTRPIILELQTARMIQIAILPIQEELELIGAGKWHCVPKQDASWSVKIVQIVYMSATLSWTVYLGDSLKTTLSLVPNGCRLLLGTAYALLRSEFVDWRSSKLSRRDNNLTVRKFLNSLGGVDQTNLTGRVLNQLNRLEWNPDFQIDVFADKGFIHKSETEQQLASFQLNNIPEMDVNDIANRFTNTYLGTGAFGVSTWERFCVGLPSANIVTQENKRDASSGNKCFQESCLHIQLQASLSNL